MTIAEDVFARCDVGSDDECWPWRGAKNLKGYGKIARAGKFHGTHRVAYESRHGPIPDGALILHSCDNPPCCNPSHLRIGTHLENSKDMVDRGRSATGEKHWSARLSSSDVQSIKTRVMAGETQRAVAKDLGLSFQHVSDIIRGKRWASAA